MVRKQSIVSTLGDSALLLPERIAEALSANDRVKYYFALLQTARANVRTPQMPAPDLHVERLAAQTREQVRGGRPREPLPDVPA